MMFVFTLSLLIAAAQCHTAVELDSLPLSLLNPILGVHGFPDCAQPANVDVHQQSLEQNQMSLQCIFLLAIYTQTLRIFEFPEFRIRKITLLAGKQKSTSAATIKVGCVGDSITAGAHRYKIYSQIQTQNRYIPYSPCIVRVQR